MQQGIPDMSSLDQRIADGAVFFVFGDWRKKLKTLRTSPLVVLLARLDASRDPGDMGLPGLRLHQMTGNLEGYWAVDVSGNWRVVFRFDGPDVYDVDYLDYH